MWGWPAFLREVPFQVVTQVGFQATIVVGIVALVSRLLGHASAALRSAVWLAGFAVLVLFPFVLKIGSPDGQEHRPRARLGPASKNTWNLNASLDRSGTAWVAFDAVASTRSNELFLAQVDAAGGARVERLTRDDGHPSKYPDVAIDGESRTALAWYDERDGTEEVYLLVTDRAGLTGEIDGRARRVTTTPGHSIGAYLAWNAGRVGLAWSDKDALQHEVYFQSFDASGMAMGATRRLTRNDTWSLVPAIRPWRDGFAMAWNEYAPATGRIHEGSSEIGFTLVK
jgi:hypothetical protein